jgi:hypothetical protein
MLDPAMPSRLMQIKRAGERNLFLQIQPQHAFARACPSAFGCPSRPE